MIEATKLSILRETSATRLQATSFVDDRQSGSHQISRCRTAPRNSINEVSKLFNRGGSLKVQFPYRRPLSDHCALPEQPR